MATQTQLAAESLQRGRSVRCRFDDAMSEYRCIGNPCILCTGATILPLQNEDNPVAKKAKPKEARKMDEQIGARVRAARIEKGMSQEKLGELLGLTFQQVQKYEKGTNRIAAPRLIEISIALDKPLAYFLHGVGGVAYDGQEASNDLDKMLGTSQGRDLIKHWHAMQGYQKSALLVMAEAMLYNAKVKP